MKRTACYAFEVIKCLVLCCFQYLNINRINI